MADVIFRLRLDGALGRNLLQALGAADEGAAAGGALLGFGLAVAIRMEAVFGHERCVSAKEARAP